MEQNLFEEFQGKKNKLKALALKAKGFGWIDESRYQGIIDKLDKDILTIGVIGQMKCGKSTFLNSFVFEDTVLPAATTPMTAALSVITYGEKKKIEAEFYTKDEWEEQKAQAERSLDDVAGNTLEESKIMAAKELVSKAGGLGSSLNGLLGKTKEDTFENLIEYVGADGKYVCITKSVKIYYPKEYLKGVEIVDTPGFNDPIVSREERTKNFLKKADVVLMMLYAGRPFDATDRDIIFKNVSQCGIGKVLIGINKYDIPYSDKTNPETEEEIKKYVKEEIGKACKECKDNTLAEILKETEPIPLSAEMALLSELPMSKVNSDDALKHAWNRYCTGFGIGSQPEMHKHSHITDLTNAIRDLIEKEKEQILFAKPLNAIRAAGNNIKQKNASEISKKESEITILKSPDEDLEQKEYNIAKATKRLNKKLGFLEVNLNDDVRKLIDKGEKALEDLVDSACNKMENIVNTDFKILTDSASLQPKVDKTISILNRDLKRNLKGLPEEVSRKFIASVEDFFTDANDIMLKYLPEFDTRDCVNGIKGIIVFDLKNVSLFDKEEDAEDGTKSWLDVIGGMVDDLLNDATFGLFRRFCNFSSHNEIKNELLNNINKMRNNFDCGSALNGFFASKDKIIQTIHEALVDEMLNPMQEQVDEIRNNIQDKKQKLKEAEASLEALNTAKKQIEEQLNEVKEDWKSHSLSHPTRNLPCHPSP